MDKSLLTSIMLFTAFTSLFSQNHNHPHEPVTDKTSTNEKGIIHCYTMEVDSINRSLNPNSLTLEEEEMWLQKKITEYKATFGERKGRNLPVLTIPVVVHVIHDGDAIGTDENISDGQIFSQITVLNEDFRKMLGTNGYNTNPVGADVEIEFCLAQVDPLGNPTNGINRVNTGVESYPSSIDVELMKPTTIWDPSQYLNIWTIKFGGSFSGATGYAQFPTGSGLTGMTGLGTATSANTDGVVLAYNAFGSIEKFPTGTYASAFNLGRSLTHEVGHYLGLRHIWGDGDCDKDDFCDDTPLQSAPNFGCPSVNISCGTEDMFQNYMDYTLGNCKNILTEDQKIRMRVVMLNSPRRNTLPSSNLCNLVPVSPTAIFVANQTTVLPNTTIFFTDLSIGTPTSWDWTISGTGWSYSGGTNTTSQHPQVIFNSLGTYTITLQVTNAQGLNTEIKTNYITVTDVVDPCVASSNQYCGTVTQFIQRVQLNTIDNDTDCSNYTDYTSTSTTLYKGDHYSVTVTPQQQYINDQIAVWIDWNGNGDFTDSGEQVGYETVTNYTTMNYVFNFTVPLTSCSDSVRMRVRNCASLSTEGLITPCGITLWGETEDYTIIIEGLPVASTYSIEKNNLENISIYPNPTNGKLFVNLSELGVQVTQIVLKDVTGRDIALKILPNGLVEFDLNHQASGVYFITILTENYSVTKKIIRI